MAMTDTRRVMSFNFREAKNWNGMVTNVATELVGAFRTSRRLLGFNILYLAGSASTYHAPLQTTANNHQFGLAKKQANDKFECLVS